MSKTVLNISFLDVGLICDDVSFSMLGVVVDASEKFSVSSFWVAMFDNNVVSSFAVDVDVANDVVEEDNSLCADIVVIVKVVVFSISVCLVTFSSVVVVLVVDVVSVISVGLDVVVVTVGASVVFAVTVIAVVAVVGDAPVIVAVVGDDSVIEVVIVVDVVAVVDNAPAVFIVVGDASVIVVVTAVAIFAVVVDSPAAVVVGCDASVMVVITVVVVVSVVEGVSDVVVVTGIDVSSFFMVAVVDSVEFGDVVVANEEVLVDFVTVSLTSLTTRLCERDSGFERIGVV